MPPRVLLLDVSRLIWRVWRGRLPTGIDRVCLEYLRHFGPRSLAVVQYRSRRFVLSQRDSDRLFALLLEGGPSARRRLAALAPLAFIRSRRRPPAAGMRYLNVGHTGLHDTRLPAWIAANRIKAVYMIHDLIPVTHPQFCRPAEAQKHALRLENALASAAGIIVNSRSTLDQLAAFAQDRRAILPPTLVAWISGQSIAEPVGPTSVDREYFVTLGTIEARKNHLLLLRVWRRLVADLRGKAPLLLIVGQRGWEAEEAEAILDGVDPLKNHVCELSDCSDEQLVGVIRNARALLMPSFVEGFGLPVVEALQLGTPVIATDLPVYREVVGDIPTYLQPDDIEAWTNVIREFIGEPPERQRQKQVIKHFRAPDWHSHFAKVEQWLLGL